MKQTCYHCTHADFRAAHQDQKSGFAYCLKNEFVKAIWMAPQRECDKGQFAPATAETMAARKRFFASMGKDVSAIECK
mgnify:FL=1